MKHLQLFEQFINESKESPKPELLKKLFAELEKAKNLHLLGWGYDPEDGHYINFENGLDSEAERHEGEQEQFAFYMNDKNDGILGVYALSGNDTELKTVEDALDYCRANEE